MQPVSYLLDGEEIVFRTRNGSKLAAATRHAVVGFEVDDFDLQARTGWSVLGIGEAYEIVDPARLAALADPHTDPWVRGHDAHTIAIPLSSSPVDAHPDVWSRKLAHASGSWPRAARPPSTGSTAPLTILAPSDSR